jgi:hypothetical protein
MVDGMEPVHSLRELFASLSGGSTAAAEDPAALLASGGHGELPGHLVAEAIGNYADTAPVEVAEHLSPYVMTHSAVPGLEPDGWQPSDSGDAAEGLAMLASAPDPGPIHDEPDDLATSLIVGHEPAPEVRPHDGTDPLHDPIHDVAHDGVADLDFGHGHDLVAAAHTPVPDFEHHDVVDPQVDAHDTVWSTDDGQPTHDVADEGIVEHHHDWDEHDSTHSLDLHHDVGDAFDPGGAA